MLVFKQSLIVSMIQSAPLQEAMGLTPEQQAEMLSLRQRWRLRVLASQQTANGLVQPMRGFQQLQPVGLLNMGLESMLHVMPACIT